MFSLAQVHCVSHGIPRTLHSMRGALRYPSLASAILTGQRHQYVRKIYRLRFYGP